MAPPQRHQQAAQRHQTLEQVGLEPVQRQAGARPRRPGAKTDSGLLEPLQGGCTFRRHGVSKVDRLGAHGDLDFAEGEHRARPASPESPVPSSPHATSLRRPLAKSLESLRNRRPTQNCTRRLRLLAGGRPGRLSGRRFSSVALRTTARYALAAARRPFAPARTCRWVARPGGCGRAEEGGVHGCGSRIDHGGRVKRGGGTSG